MTRVVGGWRDQLGAARRKLEIAGFHIGRLRAEGSAAGTERPPVPVQAHFEGALVALADAMDRVAEAANAALDLRLPSRDLVGGAFTELGSRIPAVRVWFKSALLSDLRRGLRAARYAPTEGAPGWQWEVGAPNYRGSRELIEYAAACEEHGQQLGQLLDGIEGVLAEGGPERLKEEEPWRDDG
jgi:hypothetical protein